MLVFIACKCQLCRSDDETCNWVRVNHAGMVERLRSGSIITEGATTDQPTDQPTEVAPTKKPKPTKRLQKTARKLASKPSKVVGVTGTKTGFGDECSLADCVGVSCDPILAVAPEAPYTPEEIAGSALIGDTSVIGQTLDFVSGATNDLQSLRGKPNPARISEIEKLDDAVMTVNCALRQDNAVDQEALQTISADIRRLTFKLKNVATPLASDPCGGASCVPEERCIDGACFPLVSCQAPEPAALLC